MTNYIQLQTQEAQAIPNQTNTSHHTHSPRHMIIKLQEITHKREVVKAGGVSAHRGAEVRVTGASCQEPQEPQEYAGTYLMRGVQDGGLGAQS